MRQREERVLVEPDQRTLEEGGESQVVAGQQAEGAERDQVHDRELLGQHHAVDPRHRHTLRLEGAQQMIHEGTARRTSTITSPGRMGRPRASSQASSPSAAGSRIH